MYEKQSGGELSRLDLISLTVTHLWMAPTYFIRDLVVNHGNSC